MVLDNKHYSKLKSNKQRKKERWQAFLKSFFEVQDKYQFRQVNNFMLEMRKSTSQFRDWEVAVYTLPSWRKTREYLQLKMLKTAKPNNKAVRDP